MGTLQPKFDGETVVVTGGTSGIGRETAFQFGAAGATVLVADIEEDPKDAEVPTAEAIEAAGGTATFVETDVSEREEVRDLVEAAREFGGVDVMVNNAGLYIGGSVRELDPEDFLAIQRVNALGVFLGTQVAANDMIAREDPGVVLNTASISSDVAQKGQVQYDASKGAVRMITRGSALELAEHGIRVNAVAPGHIATEFVEGWTEEAKQTIADDEMIKPVPLGRAGLPEDVAGAFLYLASEEASYVTGELVTVDGGWSVF
ncbi:short-chain dehydrogenase [Halobacteriales archaeon QS_4_69_31]|nr:MAG: short-chain dehydrogenase [Halobacteriales archaeon QS_4_69_31]